MRKNVKSCLDKNVRSRVGKPLFPNSQMLSVEGLSRFQRSDQQFLDSRRLSFEMTVRVKSSCPDQKILADPEISCIMLDSNIEFSTLTEQICVISHSQSTNYPPGFVLRLKNFVCETSIAGFWGSHFTSSCTFLAVLASSVRFVFFSLKGSLYV